MSKTKGRVTLPSEGNFLEETKEMMERWGADALRDSDGTKLPEEIKALDAKIYTTYFVARGHNEFAREHWEECQQLYLMSRRVTAVGERVEIPFMEGYFDQQVVPDYVHDQKRWWEVMDRTSGEAVAPEGWEVDQKHHVVVVKMPCPSMSIRCPSWSLPSGIRLRCTTILPMTGGTSPMRFLLTCASLHRGSLPGSILSSG